ncbi:MAG TPA: signal peptidase I [Polyangiaceae bacterium]|nr:signal peptidase I [Polyangiaceae bacterium]
MRASDLQLSATTVSRPVRVGELLQRALRLKLQLIWFGVIPLLLSAITWRYFVPHSSSAVGLEGAFRTFARERGVLLTLLVFVALSSVLRYWRIWLPGGRYLSSLPSPLVTRVPRRHIAACESACALLVALDQSSAQRRIADSSRELQESLRAARLELSALLGAGKWSKVPAVSDQLEQLARPLAQPSSVKSSLIFLAFLGVAALLALHMRARYFQAYDVMGTSMLPTLTPGEVLAGSVAAYGRSRLPRRGEVVVLQALVDGVPREVVKRVIGLPGDHITFNGVHPIINGWPVPLCEVGAYYSPNDETAQGGDPSALLVMEFLEGEAYLTLQATLAPPVADYVVKPNEIYVLGDNRSNSRDSRSFDRGAPRGFPLEDLKATVARTLFRPTARGDIDLRSALEPLGPSVYLDGADISGIRGRVSGCLALRPKNPIPPRAATTALALQP